MTTWHYFDTESDSTVGPLDESSLRMLRQGGTITDDTLVTHDSGQEWVPFGQVLGTNVSTGAGVSPGFSWTPWLLILGAMLLSYFPFAQLGHAGFLYGVIGAPTAIIVAGLIRGKQPSQAPSGLGRKIFMGALVYPLAVLAILVFAVMFAASSYRSGASRQCGLSYW